MPLAWRTAAASALLGIAFIFFSLAAHAAPGILVFGDSLSAAYGLAERRGWVALLRERLQQERLDYSVVNASISGETTSGGRSRLARQLAAHKPAILILELGANDGLRGLPVSEMRNNLAAMIREAQKSGARVLLVGVRMPPNYGEEYTRAFEAAFSDLARAHRSAFVAELMGGIGERLEYFQADRIHPTEAAQPLLLENVWKALRPMLAVAAPARRR